MRCLGIRSIANGAHWAVLDGTRQAPVLVARGVVEPPKGTHEPAALAHLREELRRLIQLYGVEYVVVRAVEQRANAREKLYPRIRAEAVALEAGQSSGLHTSHLDETRIASLLGLARPVPGTRRPRELGSLDLSRLTENEVNAILASAARLAK